jgi:hypothetical protein
VHELAAFAFRLRNSMMSTGTPRRLIGRLLLSLALLWAQQAALSHTLSHAHHARTASKSLAAEQACSDCLAYAQFFSALGTPQRLQTAAHPAVLRLELPATPDCCLSTESMFEPRAPPQGLTARSIPALTSTCPIYFA